jgi:Flp pilus assembly protein protease CpaA
MINIILFSIVLTALIIGTITDIKTREVPDWVNFGIIFTGIGIRALYSAITFDWMFLVYGLIGLGVAVVIAYIMFYAGQWGGGDAKMLMGLGALIGLPLTFDPFPLLLIFLINALLIGGFYALGCSIGLAVIHRKKFVKNFKQLISKANLMQKIALGICIVFIILISLLVKEQVIMWLFILLIVVLYLSIYLMIFIKAVELSAMFKFVEPEKLTEGDWIAKDYFVDGKKICSPKDLGISKKQIRQLINLKKKKKINKIKIKEGFPFVPSFLVAFILSLCFGAWWIIFI